MPIFSRQNPLVKRYRQARAGTDRTAIFLEGTRLIKDVLQSGVEIESVVLARELLTEPSFKALVDGLAAKQVRCEVTTWDMLQYLSDVETPPGVVALAHRTQKNLEELIGAHTGVPLLVLIEGLRDPGNLGTILRAAEAMGATAVVTTPRTVDPFSPKVVRASMGSALRLPVVDQVELPSAAAQVQSAGISIVAATPEGGTALTDVDLRPPLAFLIGNEAFGLTEEALALASVRATIPVRRAVESLNAAMAATILLYEAARQRGFSRGQGSGVSQPRLSAVL
jgi:TrmH family RNA methyltransferase